MQLDDNQVSSIVERVVERLGAVKPQVEQKSPPPPRVESPSLAGSLGLFTDIESAIRASERAFSTYKDVAVVTRKKIIEAIREICRSNVKQLAQLALDETGLGRYEDKITKNLLAINKTPGVEDLEPIAFTGDDGLTLLERAPFGIIGSITPCTNPSETIINNGISMIAGGNSVVFNPHPSARRVSAFTVDLLNKAVMSEGGPANLFATVANPTIESAKSLMVHPKISLLVVTGGPAVVSQAMKSGKRVIAAGPGNPPVVVDETADIDQAAADIIMSASTDNNIICVIEKEIIATAPIADQLKKALVKHGGIELGLHQAKRLEKRAHV